VLTGSHGAGTPETMAAYKLNSYIFRNIYDMRSANCCAQPFFTERQLQTLGQEKTYGDVTKFMSVDDVLKNFGVKFLELKGLLDFISKGESSGNDYRRFVDINVLTRAITELQRIGKNTLDNEAVAHAARNMFELNMIYRYTHINTDNLKEWIGNKCQDEIDILEGILKLSQSPGSDNEKILKERLSHIRLTAEKHNIKVSKQLTTKALADKVGLTTEYDGLFKLYSKFVHPTSWLINSKDEEVTSSEYKTILLIQFQTYLFDLEGRLSEFYNYKR